MNLHENSTFYEVLDLKPDASAQDVREAYLRTKAAYNRDSVALYSLVGVDERDEMLLRIEEAYEILSNPDKRKRYDEQHGTIEFKDDRNFPTRPPNKKIISIDRVPPMEAEGEDLLVAPPTDFEMSETTKETPSQRFEPPPQPVPATPKPAAAAPREEMQRQERVLVEEIAQQTEFRGPFLKRVRESRRISIEEMANITKINKSYLLAIEEDNFQKLPAVVFVRGFVTQVARTLRLPSEKVVSAYLTRYTQARPEKAR